MLEFAAVIMVIFNQGEAKLHLTFGNDLQIRETEAIGMGVALEGLKVIELGNAVSAPFCAAMMADFGARVIKIESPKPHPNKKALHTEELIQMLSYLAFNLYGIKTEEEETLASFLSRAVISGDSVTFFLFGNRTPFSFHQIHGEWKALTETEESFAKIF